MKKIITVLLTVVMCATLAGCGSSVDPNASALEREVEVTETPVVVDLPADEAWANNESWTGEVQDEPYEEETYVADDDSEAELSGLMIVQADWHNGKVLQYTVYAVDPETGASREVSQFQFTHLYKESETESTIVPVQGFNIYSNLYDHFSGDYTKIAATKKILASGEVHAGWLDASGNFFDVTEMLNEQAQTDFDEPASYYAVGFQDNIFVYVSSEYRQKDQYYAVSLDNITPGASWELEASDRLLIGREYATWGWMSGYKVTDWLNDDQALVEILQDHSKGSRCRIATVSTQTFEEYLPGEDTNSNWSAVVSPDGSRVAFISRRVSGEDVNFYITSISGESPIKLEPDFAPVFSPSTEILLTYGGACCYILEWR